MSTTPAELPEDSPRPPNTGDWMVLAEQAAFAVGDTFSVGVRSHSRGWFAHCDGIEYDGLPAVSVPAVIEGLRDRAERHKAEHRRSVVSADAVLAGLPAAPTEDRRADDQR